ncbi:structure-specific recognition protein-domain-containing protein [Blyttiomyces helicus]|uniref:Structure-specific recognition protein-domain-containing protein n=1 Tax=Blyttiomyces helicus TaxID=388810 RepID=A0A4P9W7K6_9FUNG|nr:structure-specific recognition protein-domain-containing protein [Blyttiomyces helicus]|eukprot:RKO88072.1 structure-specific recognition protein-domain-containing protein [Blyttiomyces helicus]
MVVAVEIVKMRWLRCARDYQLRVQIKNGDVFKILFPPSASERLNTSAKNLYGISLRSTELSLPGWNWASTEFSSSQMTFNVANRPAFKVPLTEVGNTTLANRIEVSVEFVTREQEKPLEPGQRRLRSIEDLLVEIRFFVPGMAVTSEVGEGPDGRKQLKDKDHMLCNAELENGKEEGEISVDAEEPVLVEDGEAPSAATLLYEPTQSKADVGISLSDSIITSGIAKHSRKPSADHCLAIVHLSLLTKPDDLHHVFFERDEEVESDLNVDEKSYDGPTYEVVSDILKGLSGKSINIPGGNYKSAQGHTGIKFYQKAVERSLALPSGKPGIYISHREIAAVPFSRVDAGGANALRTFGINSMSGRRGSDIDSDDSGMNKRKRGVIEDRRMGDDEDEDESEDEDFVAESDSDVAEEYDSPTSDVEAEMPTKKSSKKDRRGSGGSSGTGGSDSDSPKKSVKPKLSAKPSNPSKTFPEPAKKKAKKDEKAPKGVLTPYLLFMRAKRPEVTTEFPDPSTTEVAKKIGEMWKSIWADDKAENKPKQPKAVEYESSGAAAAFAASSSLKTSSKPASSKPASASAKTARKSAPASKGMSAEFVSDTDD